MEEARKVEVGLFDIETN